MRTSVALIAAFFGVTNVGCASDPIAESEVESSVVVANSLTMNGLSRNSVTLNSLAENGLTQNRIAVNDLVVDATGREVARYLISCALRADQELTVTVEGVDYTFPGQLGLAPAWVDRALRDSEQGWVSACMLARVNAYDVSVLVSLRGKHAALVTSEDERVDFPVQEAGFYGNIFTDGGPIDANACLGLDQAAGETGALEDRDCAEEDAGNPGSTLCGFNYAGHCGAFTQQTEYACKHYASSVPANERDHRSPDVVGADDDAKKPTGDPTAEDGGYYRDCHDEAGAGKWRGATRYRQVITVYLQR